MAIPVILWLTRSAVPAEPPPSLVQVTPGRIQPLGTVSVTELLAAMISDAGVAVTVPLRGVIGRGSGVGVVVRALMPKFNVLSAPVVCLTMLRKPPPGLTMQSFGLL